MNSILDAMSKYADLLETNQEELKNHRCCSNCLGQFMDPMKVNVYTCPKCDHTTNEHTPWNGEETFQKIRHTKDLCQKCYDSSRIPCSHSKSDYIRIRLRSQY